MMSPGQAAVGTAPLLAAYGPPFGFCRGGADASREMRHVRELLRLRTAGISGNEIARRLNLAPSTVRLTLQRLATAGLLDWPLPPELTDAALEARLFSAAGSKQGHRRHSEPDWAEVHRELKRKHVTLQILWEEYIERCPARAPPTSPTRKSPGRRRSAI